MSNFIYKKAKQALLNGDIDVDTKNLQVLFIDTTAYTADENTDEFVSHISPSAIKARSAALVNKTTTNGIFDADDANVVQYAGNPFHAIILYQVDFSDENSRLISYIDTSDGLPFEGTNAPQDVTISWSNNIHKIISL